MSLTNNDTPSDILHVKCPTCKKVVPWIDSSTYRPFCSERCKLIDLGEWASESHKIPGDNLDINSDDLT